jgi:hypothetical protein
MTTDTGELTCSDRVRDDLTVQVDLERRVLETVRPACR